MVCTRWFHSIFVILQLHVSLANHSDKIVQCDFIDNVNLRYYCSGSVEKENSHKGSYFCCESYLYCFGDTCAYKKNIQLIEFWPGCHFPRFELSIFKSYVAIKKLSLSNVHLEIVRLQDFKYAENLMVFDALHNKLIEIPTMLFTNAPEITEVNFSFNEISRIDPMAFDHSKLIVLDLSNNKIISIDNQTFAALPALTTLFLSSNLIQVIDVDVFAQNRALNLLQLPYNKLTTFACQNFESLEHLDLTSNRLTSFDVHCMSSISGDLNIEYNQITIITLNSNLTDVRAFSNKLKWITVESDLDAVETFNVKLFSRLGKALKLLDVTDNFVGKLNVSTFMNMENLEKLVLRNTSLSNIQYGTFHHQKNLKLLDISFNNLKTIKLNAFWQDFRQLETFFLDGNNLTEMDGLTERKFPNVTHLGITKNNFTCEYLSDFMLDWTDATFVPDAPLNGNHIQKILCYDGTTVSTEVTEVQYVTKFHNYVTREWRFKSEKTINQPATKVIEHVYNDSTNRVLLILVLVVLCIICIVIVTKNVILIWRTHMFRDEANVTYCMNGRRYDVAENSVEIIRTDLLTSD